MLGEVDAAFSLWDRFKKWWIARRPASKSIASRIVGLFESHGVHRNQIPRFFGHGLTLKDVQDDASLLQKLDEPLLDAVCRRFLIRREWLDGAEEQIHPTCDFYKSPGDFVRFLDELLASNPDGRVWGAVLAPKDPAGEALVILQETIGTVGNKEIYRYYLLNNWILAYWKSRAYLTACVAIAWKRRVYIHGITMADSDIKVLATGEALLGWKGDGIGALGCGKWYPEDMALEPKAYLNGVDPERDNFGIVSALNLWLELDQQGFMDTGLNLEEARQKFQKELVKYRSAMQPG